MRFGLIIGDDALQQLRQGVGDIDRFALAVPAPLGKTVIFLPFSLRSPRETLSVFVILG